ncbi:TPA: helix-turn-helix transcriptional regulator [Streptococcus pneumoniae]
MVGRGTLTPLELKLRTDISDNLNKLKQEKGYNQQDIVKGSGISQSTLSQYFAGKRLPSKKNAEILADFFEVPIEVIDPRLSNSPAPTTSPIQSIYDQLEPPRQRKVITYAEKLRDEQETRRKAKINEVSEKIVQLYGYDYYDHAASAGTGQYLNDVRVERIELPVDVDADFVIPIKGDSMEPDYHDGDLVFIQTSVDLNDGVIGVFNYNGEAYIKQLVIDTEQSYLHSLNPDYKDMPITPETDFRIIGEVVDLYREK